MSQQRVSKKPTSGSSRKAFDPVEGLLPPIIQPSVPYGVYLQAYKDYLLFREHLLQEKWDRQANADRTRVTVQPGSEVHKAVGPQGQSTQIIFGTLVPVQTTVPLTTRPPKRSTVRPKFPAGVVRSRDGLRWLATDALLEEKFGVYVQDEDNFVLTGQTSIDAVGPAGVVITSGRDARRLGDDLATDLVRGYELRLARYLKATTPDTFTPKVPPAPKAAKPKAQTTPPKSEAAKLTARREKRRRQRANRKARKEAAHLKEVKSEAEKLRAETRLLQAKAAIATANAKLNKVAGPTEIRPAAPKQPSTTATAPAVEESETKRVSAAKLRRKEKRRGIFGPPRE